MTIENVEEYIELALSAIFRDSVNLQLQSFKKGFNSILPIENLRAFEYAELESLVCGELMNEEDWQKDLLLSFFKAGHGYS